jgi:hypothetical protein
LYFSKLINSGILFNTFGVQIKLKNEKSTLTALTLTLTGFLQQKKLAQQAQF